MINKTAVFVSYSIRVLYLALFLVDYSAKIIYIQENFQKRLVMKQFKALLFILAVCAINYSFASGNTTYNSITLFDFDASCMQQYEYEVDQGFIIDDDHTAYHIRLDDERTLVLKVLNSTEGSSTIQTSFTVLHDCISVKGIQPQFVISVNNNNTPVFIKKGSLYYQVTTAEYNLDNSSFFSSFAPPHHSFVFEYHSNYDPVETLRPVALDALDYDTRTYYYSTEQEREANNFIYLQMYRDACPNRPYGLATPISDEVKQSNNDQTTTSVSTTSTSNTTSKTGIKQVYRTCQYPVEVRHIKGIGTTERFYKENEKVYRSKLVSIDGVDLETYLQSHSFENENVHKSGNMQNEIVWEYDLTKTPETSPYQPSYIVGFSGDVKTNSNTQLSSSNTEKGGAKETTSNSVTLSVPNIVIDGVKHTVQKGETLYSISQKYNVSVLDIKIDNQLSENTIEIGQELVISKK